MSPLTYVAMVLALFLIPGPAVLLALERATGGHRVGPAATRKVPNLTADL